MPRDYAGTRSTARLIILSCCLLSAATASSGRDQAASASTVGKLHLKTEDDDRKQISPAAIDLDDPTGYFKSNSLRELYTGRVSFDQYVAHAMRSIALVAGYDNDLHRYDSDADLINSFERNLTYGHDLSSMRAHIDSSEAALLRDASELTLIENERNQATCARHLDAISEGALGLFRDHASFSHSTRLDLIDFLDSFGAAPREQLMMGNTMWLGGYEQCQAARVELAPGDRRSVIGGRYCVAHLRMPSWSRARPADQISLGSESFKLGVCLPRACNSISILRHAARIESLVRLVRLQQVPYSSLRLTQLFCLPDETSPMRQLSTSARIFLALASVWLSLVVYFSLKLEFTAAKRRACGQLVDLNLSKLTRVFALRHAWQKLCNENQERSEEVAPAQKMTSARYRESVEFSAQQVAVALASDEVIRKSIVMKIHSGGLDSGLASRQQSSSSSSSSNSGSMSSLSSEDAADLPQKRRQQSIATCTSERNTPERRPNLAAIDGIKVISMIWLISGHTMLFFIRNITNGRQFWTILLDARFLTIMAGIFPVDSFFTATGVLTTYLKFASKSGESRRALRTLKYWLEIFVHRYLRFMPMYLLVFWYTRDVSEYIGHGPMWDYATASTSLRSICKQESALVPLLFQANFKPIEQHCVKPAWYLANDYQYLLITPVFVLLLLLSRWLGYLVIASLVCASLVMQFLTVYNKPPEAFGDFEALANFRPMFATYVLKNLWQLYVLPYNRIPPYLIGLLTGHLMYRYNKAKRRRRQEANSEHSANSRSGSTSNKSSPASSTESLVSSTPSSAPDLRTTSGAAGGEQPPLARGARPSSHDDKRHGIKHPGTIGGLASSLSQQETSAPPQCASARDDEEEEGKRRKSALFIFTLVLQHVNMNVWTPVALLLAIIYLPMLTQLLGQQEGEQAKIVASSIIALMRFVWSLSVARLIYLCYVSTTTTTTTTTSGGRGARPKNGSLVISLLSSPKWRPFSKIGLSVLLIQWEIIGYVNQVQAGPPLMSISYLLAFVIICVLLSYALGLIVYLVFEFPMSQIELLYVRPALFRRKRTE